MAFDTRGGNRWDWSNYNTKKGTGSGGFVNRNPVADSTGSGRAPGQSAREYAQGMFQGMARTQDDMRAAGGLAPGETIGSVAAAGAAPGSTVTDRARATMTGNLVDQNVQRNTGQIAPTQTIGVQAMQDQNAANPAGPQFTPQQIRQSEYAAQKAAWKPTGNSPLAGASGSMAPTIYANGKGPGINAQQRAQMLAQKKARAAAKNPAAPTAPAAPPPPNIAPPPQQPLSATVMPMLNSNTSVV